MNARNVLAALVVVGAFALPVVGFDREPVSSESSDTAAPHEAPWPGVGERELVRNADGTLTVRTSVETVDLATGERTLRRVTVRATPTVRRLDALRADGTAVVAPTGGR